MDTLSTATTLDVNTRAKDKLQLEQSNPPSKIVGKKNKMKGSKDCWFCFLLSLYFLLYMLGYQNIWSLNGPQNHKANNVWINKYKFSFVGLLEIKIASNKMKEG